MRVTVHAAKTNLSKLIDAALSGEEVVIAKAGEPVLQLVPIKKKKDGARRKFGQNFLGITYIAPDFYDDLPLDMFEVMRDESNEKE